MRFSASHLGAIQNLGLTIKALFEKFQSVLFLDPHDSGHIFIFPLYFVILLVAILDWHYSNKAQTFLSAKHWLVEFVGRRNPLIINPY